MRCRHDLSGGPGALQSPLEQNKNIRRVTPRPAVCVWIIVAAPPFDLAGEGRRAVSAIAAFSACRAAARTMQSKTR